MMELYAVNICNDFTLTDYETALRLVSREKRERINRFKFIDDRKRTLCGETMIRYLIQDKLKICGSEVRFISNEYGKPYLENNEEFYFSISHSGAYVICGISTEEVGVDIELIKPIDIEPFAKVFTETEYQEIVDSGNNSLNQFYTYWTLKESYIKYKGKGLSIPMDSFSLVKEKQKYTLKENTDGLHFSTFKFGGNYIISVTCKTMLQAKDVHNLKMREIIEYFNKEI